MKSDLKMCMRLIPLQQRETSTVEREESNSPLQRNTATVNGSDLENVPVMKSTCFNRSLCSLVQKMLETEDEQATRVSFDPSDLGYYLPRDIMHGYLILYKQQYGQMVYIQGINGDLLGITDGQIITGRKLNSFLQGGNFVDISGISWPVMKSAEKSLMRKIAQKLIEFEYRRA